MQMQKEIATILMNEWDPIGIKGVPQAQDEYDVYAMHIASMLNFGSTESEIVLYIFKSETESMGLKGDLLRAARVAKNVCEVRNRVP